jgi:hypothetical protein
MHFDFMTPALWDGLVIGTVLIGTSLAILRVISDRSVYSRRHRSSANGTPPSAPPELAKPPKKQTRR